LHQTQTSVSQLGKDTTLSDDTISACEAFVCILYTKNEIAGSKALALLSKGQKWQRNKGLPATSDSLH